MEIVYYLEKNFEFNYVKNGVIHKKAVNDKSGIFNFLVPKNHSGVGMLSNRHANMKVECVNSNYFNEVLKNLNTMVFVKIDVEGSELIVLNELFKSDINFLISKIFIEITNTFPGKKEEIYRLFKNLGFREVYSKKLNQNSFDVMFVR